MSEYFDLELLKMRAQVLESAIKSNRDLDYYIKPEFVQLMDDLREAWLSVSTLNKESQ
jgi:hypothetical protein